jgi:hypothetical protein
LNLKCLPCLVFIAGFTRLCRAFAGDAAPPAFDAAPFAVSLPAGQGQGLQWEDPREIHSVEVVFAEPISRGLKLRLEYWGSHWPEQHLPKDREPGGGDTGWMELGNWSKGGWRVADSEQSVSGSSVRFTFHPVNAREFPALRDYASTGRFTLKIRVTADQSLPHIERIRALTDSTVVQRAIQIAFAGPPAADFRSSAFNGEVLAATPAKSYARTLRIHATTNPDPNTFDGTLITITNGTNAFTIKVDDLKDGALYLPEFGAAILPENDSRDYQAVAQQTAAAGNKTLYDRISAMPEQTWTSAWNGMPPKKCHIPFVLGIDGSRQKFRLDSDGGVFIRWNDQYMKAIPAQDTARIALETPPVQMRFGLPKIPGDRHIEEESIPTCITTWQQEGIRITETAFATVLAGFRTNSSPPAPDECSVAMLRFEFTNTASEARTASLPISIFGGESYAQIRLDAKGLLWNGNLLRGQVSAESLPTVSTNQLFWNEGLPAHSTKRLTIKMPYFPLIETGEADALALLDFERERDATERYWRDTLNKSTRLITPEPALNDFYTAVPGHLLINCELEPGSARRLARVGSFNYGNYGNESGMMVLDLDRRGYHQQAADCLEAWLHYQGTVALPGDFDSKQGVLYGAGGYEANGYNQHHGWILWTLVEHYRFTRDEAWLRRIAPNLVSAADWIIRESERTKARNDLSIGLLPPGELEDIGDWWTWLSTSCYTWRGLDAAAWALEQIHQPGAARIRAAANEYHRHLVDNFSSASVRSPVVRLRDGTSVPQVPSYVERRGRSFGWICETLEGSMHLLITKAIDPKSVQAQWILKDYEDNLFLSNQYGYTLDDFDRYWFGRGGMSMQACLLLDVEAYLYRDDVKQALRAMFNAIALNNFPDVHMNTEHALPEMGDCRGDVYKTSDEANACGWLRYLFVREEDDALLLGQAIPREWLKPGQKCGIQNAATYFGPASILYRGEPGRIVAKLQGPVRNPPREIRMRFRTPDERRLERVTVNGKPWEKIEGDWVILPGNIGEASVEVAYQPR